jgi:hypothetical protein
MGEAACTVHPENEALGPCSRCGNFLCEVCRCKFRDQILCVACVERALQPSEATPEQARTHFRQALLALVLGIAAWLLCVLAFLGGVVAASGGGEPNIAVLVLVALVILSAVLVALFGVGQGAAALRMRGNHMILATIGLIVSGLYVGTIIGLLAFFGIWQN